MGLGVKDLVSSWFVLPSGHGSLEKSRARCASVTRKVATVPTSQGGCEGSRRQCALEEGLCKLSSALQMLIAVLSHLCFYLPCSPLGLFCGSIAVCKTLKQFFLQYTQVFYDIFLGCKLQDLMCFCPTSFSRLQAHSVEGLCLCCSSQRKTSGNASELRLSAQPRWVRLPWPACPTCAFPSSLLSHSDNYHTRPY